MIGVVSAACEQSGTREGPLVSDILVMRHRLMRKHLMITSTAIGTFTPANRDDFGARARFLSKLLKQPYQRCQESLAKLYGYGDLHQLDRKSTRLNSSHYCAYRMPSSA